MSPRPAFLPVPARLALAVVQRVCFWLTVVLPLAYLLLLAVNPPNAPVLLVGAVGLNALAAAAGRGYTGQAARGTRSSRADS